VPWQLRLDTPTAARSGDVVARLSGATVRVADDFTLGPIDLLVTAGERIALVGVNGSGKTTLLNTMLGRVAPAGGTAQLGRSVIFGEIGQARDQLLATGDVTLLRAFQDVVNAGHRPDPGSMDAGDARTLLAKFGLVADHVLRSPATLSPGERTRASLAVLMARRTNLLVLDEPTNHLDLPAIEQLEVALDAFGGTVVLVTHDRSLLEQVKLTRRIELANGKVVSDEAIAAASA
jgi:ATPase subunit of ABC transporter with duplicated ATPase domains